MSFQGFEISIETLYKTYCEILMQGFCAFFCSNLYPITYTFIYDSIYKLKRIIILIAQICSFQTHEIERNLKSLL
jgi:hypothetical protein